MARTPPLIHIDSNVPIYAASRLAPVAGRCAADARAAAGQPSLDGTSGRRRGKRRPVAPSRGIDQFLSGERGAPGRTRTDDRPLRRPPAPSLGTDAESRWE
jgi:hypothetical protein